MAGNRATFEQAMSRGASAAWDQQWERAIAYYRAALTEFPDDVGALTALGFALFQTDRLDDSMAAYQRAAMLAPGDPVAPEKVGEIFEKQGRLNESAQTYLAVAEMHLTKRDVPKAIELWTRVVTIAPDNLNARLRLVRALENSNQSRAAALEYIDLARIFQSTREVEKAGQSLQRAGQLDPQLPELRAAAESLKRNRPIAPVNRAAKRGTGMLSPGALAESPDAKASANGAAATGTNASPLGAAKETAFARLAEMLFEEDADTSKSSSSVSVFTRGSARDEQSQRAQVVMFLGQALTSATSHNPEVAFSNFKAALDAGLDHPLVHFILGALQLEKGNAEEAIPYLTASIGHEAVMLGALYGLGEAYSRNGDARESFNSYFEALKRLDMKLIAPDRQDRLAEAYETLADSYARTDEVELSKLIPALRRFLSGENWEQRAQQARQQLDAGEDGLVSALADTLTTPGNDRVMESLHRIDDYMRRKFYATAMEEALYALEASPTYLPVHIRMAEILVAEGRQDMAATKYRVIAKTYQVRGEVGRAARLMQQVLKINPLDIPSRRELIELYSSAGRADEALTQYGELARTYYDLADLETARETIADALKLAQQSGARQASLALLHQMGDIDMQRLQWRDAVRVYEQAKGIDPTDQKARIALIDLNFRLANARQAMVELDAYLKDLFAARQLGAATQLLEELLNSHSDNTAIIARLARVYQDQGRRADAITRYDQLGDIQLQNGQNQPAMETLRTILSLGPDDPKPYQQLLDQLQNA
ncbi:MAG: tetratricopeptide repeat protein [Anaerolineales bacterium]